MDVLSPLLSLEEAEKKNAIMIDLKNAELPIVDIEKPAEEEVPDKVSAQALYNSKVKEETTAQSFAKKATPVSVPPRPSPQPFVPVGKGRESPTVRGASNSMQDELAALQRDQKQKEQKSFERFDSTKNVVLPPTSLDDDGGSFDDYIPEYKYGGHTYVNAMANPQIAYYVELKRKFKLTWTPLPQLPPTPNLPVQVVWGLTVDASGQIAHAVLIQGSGLPRYDAEAKRTMLVSAPFSHPPQNLLGPDNQLHVAWAFTVY